MLLNFLIHFALSEINAVIYSFLMLELAGYCCVFILEFQNFVRENSEEFTPTFAICYVACKGD